MREVEKRVDGMRKNKDKAEDAAKQREPAASSRWTGPRTACRKTFASTCALMCDIIAIAFQTDKTRVATLLSARDLSALYYPFLEVRDGASLRVAQQQLRRLRAHLALPPQPARVSGARSSTACRKATARCSTTRA